ncbi:DgyrCDS4987 [Dimorphilus gyrociliatus]|uniref:DgyrCDS4987 n=1 Tax=Dimorphilus gyrociliatus TaxID=2664684 RepID=A0A7I8VL64_9ANNE|nr:DgyrCDS4987 [Dimorphilus gyrociliatus]
MWRSLKEVTRVLRQQCNLTACNSITPEEKSKKKKRNSFILSRATEPLISGIDNEEKSNKKTKSECYQDFIKSIVNECRVKDVFGLGSAIAVGSELKKLFSDDDRAKVNAMQTKEELKEIGKAEKRRRTNRSLDELNRETEALLQGLRGAQLAQVGKKTEAVKAWLTSAKFGHSFSNYNLGLAYELGHGVQKSVEKAVYYYEKAANDEHPSALHNLGVLYIDNGLNLERGNELIAKAAEYGVAEAQTFVGVKHMRNGNQTMAANLFKEAAKQENAEAQYYLGLCYDNGLGVEENKHLAIELFKKSSKNGNQEAKEELERRGIQRTRLRSSSSSPTLTEYVRDYGEELFSFDQNWEKNVFSIVYGSFTANYANDLVRCKSTSELNAIG